MMDLLKITMFPSGPGAYLASTYDETTANPYPNLPDPLLMNNGTKVTTPAQWAKRRAEIVELFDREVYGRRPEVLPKVKWEVLSTTTGTDWRHTRRHEQLVGHVDNSSYPAITVNIGVRSSRRRMRRGPCRSSCMFGGGGLPDASERTAESVRASRGAPARGAVAGGAARARGGAGGGPPRRRRVRLARRRCSSSGWGYASSTPPASRPTAAAG